MKTKHAHSVIETLEARIAPAVFIVTSAADTGAGSLREAIEDANATPALDKIKFNIPGAGSHVISLQSELPDIIAPVKILGNTEPGYKSAPLVALDGTAAGVGANGLKLQSHDGSLVRGLAVYGFDNVGIFIVTGADHKIVGNYVGVTLAGDGTVANGRGIALSIFSEDNVIGGTNKADRNVIAGNSSSGIDIVQSGGTKILGNYIGVLADGLFPGGNGGPGISVGTGSADTVIGGAEKGARNIISGNGQNGVAVSGAGTIGTIIAGNYIGTDKTGTQSFGNGANGININSASEDTTVGGKTKAHGNVISGNGDKGISVGGDGTKIMNNLIGTQKDGKTGLGNNADGVLALSASSDNVISKNIIAFNGDAGVRLADALSENNRISRNKMFSNGGLGIDLGTVGATLNDVNDVDGGANGLQNFPLLTSATLLGSGTTKIVGSLDVAAGSYTVEFFLSDGDGSGFGEGQKFLGSKVITSDGITDPTIKFSVLGLKVGQKITATATSATGATSEFSQIVSVAKPV